MARSIGQQLKVARETRGQSLVDIARFCKVSPKQLLALENETLDIFKAKVYARGCFKVYADYLGIYNNKNAWAFDRLLTNSNPEKNLKVPTKKSWLKARLTPKVVLAVAVGCLGLLVGGYVFAQVGSYFSLPALFLSSPQGEIVQSKEITVSGTTDPEAVVTINATQVAVGEDGLFSMPLYLQSGINVIQVKSTNAAGRSRYITKHLLVPKRELQ